MNREVQYYTIRERTLPEKIRFWLTFKYYNIKVDLNQWLTGISWMLLGYTREYYDYKTKKLVSMGGYEYLKRISTDMGEIAIFKARGSKERSCCERF